ncbi:MAG: carboxypeptidase-like regulatory domain-containing protein [Candidatus Thermoplasmatota archaeon]|nr:carboxypeptidase-like regulatory domain-containing protein [Candidatus Thermoplasmatota archaeon]
MKKVIAVTATLLIAVTAIGPLASASSQQCLGNIRGFVYIENGKWPMTPIPFVTIQAGSRTTMTGMFGYYAIIGLPLGTFEVTVSKPGYAKQSKTVTLTQENPDAWSDFILEQGNVVLQQKTVFLGAL